MLIHTSTAILKRWVRVQISLSCLKVFSFIINFIRFGFCNTGLNRGYISGLLFYPYLHISNPVTEFMNNLPPNIIQSLFSWISFQVWEGFLQKLFGKTRLIQDFEFFNKKGLLSKERELEIVAMGYAIRWVNLIECN